MGGIVVRLSTRVKRRLRKGMEQMRDGRLKLRYQIVLLWSAGKSSGEIAASLGCAVSTAARWAPRSVADGEAGLIDRRSEIGQTKVDVDVLPAVAEMIQEAPTGSGWQRSMWTRELIASELEKRTGIGLSITTIGRMLTRLGDRAVAICSLTPALCEEECVSAAFPLLLSREKM